MRSPACSLVESRLPAIASGTNQRRLVARHVSICLRCQAEAAKYRRLGRQLAALRHESLAAPAFLAVAVDAAIASRAAVPEDTAAVGAVVAAGWAVVAAVGTVAVVKWVRARSPA